MRRDTLNTTTFGNMLVGNEKSGGSEAADAGQEGSCVGEFGCGIGGFRGSWEVSKIYLRFSLSGKYT